MGKLKLDDVEVIQSKPVNEKIEKTPEGFYKIDGLPSKGKMYPEGTIIYSRPLKILEVKQLSTINEENFNEIINSVLSKTVIGIEVEDLVVADKLFIIFWQRANTYKGDAFSIEHTCNLCNTKGEYNFEVSQLTIKDAPDDFDPDKEIELPSGVKMKVNQLTVKTENIADKFLKENPDADVDLVAISSVITEINGEEGPININYDKILNMQPADILSLINKYNKIEISLEPTLKVACSNCGGQAETPVSFHGQFFLPEYRAS